MSEVNRFDLVMSGYFMEMVITEDGDHMDYDEHEKIVSKQAEDIKLLREELISQRVNMSNLIGFRMVDENYFNAVKIKINNIDKALAATNQDKE